MATYINGVTDYIPQVQPFVPDYNFLGNVLQTKQSQYDQGFKQVNSAYNSLLNSPMSRDTNIKRRDEFFKVINQDIKKVSGLDLSKQENVASAQQIFKGFYEDKDMVNDMVKTRQHNDELERGMNFKDCNDPKKCGGVYNEDSIKELQYKMDEFKKMSDKDAMNWRPGTYTQYYDWQKDAIKEATDVGMKVTRDSESKDGKWIVRDQNGTLIQGGLYSLFKQLHGNDPRVDANYRTKAYVTRKDYIQAVLPQYDGDEALAEKDYIDTHLNKVMQVADKQLVDETNNLDNLNSAIRFYESKKGVLTTKEKQFYNQALEQKKTLSQSVSQLQSNHDQIVNNINKADIGSLRNRVDFGMANLMEDHDMNQLAYTMSKKDELHELKANPYGEISARAAVDRQLKMLDLYNDLSKMKVKHGYDMEDITLKHKLENLAMSPYALTADKENAPGSDYQLDLKNHPELEYNRQHTDEITDGKEASRLATDRMYNLFNEAKRAITTQGSAGARKHLNDTYGSNWADITDKNSFIEALNKNKLSATTLYLNSLKQLNQDKNGTSDVGWAQSTLNQNKASDYRLSQFVTAAQAKAHFLISNTKRAVDATKGQATGENAYLNDADLVAKGNIVNPYTEAPPEFIEDYITRHQDEGATEDNAKEMYPILRNAVLNNFNKLKDASIDQGTGLGGVGMFSSKGKAFEGFDPASVKSDPTGFTANTLRDMSRILNSDHVTTVGGIDKDALRKGTDEKVEVVAQDILQKSLTANPKDPKRIRYTIIPHPVAGNDSNMSAIRLMVGPEDIKEYIGTKENPGPLYDKSGKTQAEVLKDGITIFYNKNQVPTNFNSMLAKSSLETILRTNGNYSIDSYDGTAGTVEFSRDHSTDNVIVTTHPKGYKNGVFTELPGNSFTVPMQNLDQAEETALKSLELKHQDNLKWMKVEAHNNQLASREQ